MLTTEINGLFPPAYTPSGRVNLSQLAGSGGKRPDPPRIGIEDARRLQAGEPEAAFFATHGFVLLDAPSAVRDWDCDQAEPGNEIARVYMPEVDALIRERLYPGRRLEIHQPPRIVRRGPGTGNPDYALNVHQDHGLHVDDFQTNIAAFTNPEIGRQWRWRYERDDVEGFVVLDFWRTAGMAAPLDHMPLAICEPATVDRADVIETALEGIAPNGATTHHLSLRGNPGQRWVYYPRMTADEVLVFKLFEARRDDADAPLASCFHTAVVDPDCPPDAPKRQSCEHRVSVMLLRG